MRGSLARPLFVGWQAQADARADDYDALRADIGKALDEVRAARAAAGQELAAVYLPELTESALASAERRTGFRGFSRRNPIQVMPREEAKLTQLLTSIEADARYVKREALAGPYGSLTRALEEAEANLDPWLKECEGYESHAGFLELVDVKYDTPEFAERWWQPAYWRHWADGDRITAALGKADFGDDVLPAYLEARKNLDNWREQVRLARERLEAVHELVRRHDETLWRRDHLAEVYLDESRKVLATHLEGADAALLLQWAEDDRGILVLLKRISGLRAKEDVLTDLRDRWANTQGRSLRDAAMKWKLKANKLGSAKKAAQDLVVPAGVDEKLAAHGERVQKARSFVERVRSFDEYDRYDLHQPPETWYLHFSGNRRPGAFTPQYRTWYDRHPDIVVVTDPTWESARVPIDVAPDLAAAGDVS